MVKAASKTANAKPRAGKSAAANRTAAVQARHSASGARAAKAPAAKPSAAKPSAAKSSAAKTSTKLSVAKPSVAKPSVAKPSVAKPAAPAAPTTTELGYLSSFLGFHLRLAQDASYRAFARVTDNDLVKPGRFPALAIIHLNPGISQSALGRAIARDKSTVSPLIKDLQQNGLISRKPSPSDRRSVTLALTKKGERMLDRLHARALEHEQELDQIVGTAKGRLVATLEKITGGLGAGA